MRRLRSGWASALLAVAAVTLTVAGAPLAVEVHQTGGWITSSALFLPFAVVGLLIVHRQPQNPVGWVMVVLYLLYTLSGTAGLYAVLAFRFDHPGLPLARLAVASTQFWIALVLLLPVPILLYPDGVVPSGRWRWTVWAYVAVCAGLVMGTAVKDLSAFTVHPVRVDSSGELETLSGTAQHGLAASIGTGLFVAYVLLALSWVVRQFLTYRHATPVRRAQLKWLASGAVLGVVGLSLALTFSQSSQPLLRMLSVGFIGVAAVPVSIGVGILRYHLYDIDRLLSRTTSYLVVTAVVIGVYIGVVTAASRLFPSSSSLSVAAATLAAAAVFRPVLTRVQRVVDRRFDRSRYDAQRTADTFVTGLRNHIDADSVVTDLLDVVRATMTPASSTVWLNDDRPRVT
jgi:hypothetical protein